MTDDGEDRSGRPTARLPRCPYCEGDDVARLYLGSVQLDSCECRSCGARWDEDPLSGSFRGRASRASVVVPRGRTEPGTPT